ncbi:hypothetical protein TEA_021687 [Camellia sinensis var. sinensis]|uniref:phosphogluconate dehydrogenase (NADP(+)-dependent, decarboxylating) n=1 Tax=Camellia sinensis var. sinensis TaxID=542762 RepID=A0A4S4EJS3_CAMSN|nr:hypothetical protein TEA_021687 [Camellia sinensis var. sinensis]
MATLTRIGLAGLAVMGQNLALDIAEKGFPLSVYNRTTSKVDETVERAKLEGKLPLHGFHDPESFVHSIQKPRVIIMLVKAGSPVDQTIKTLSVHMEKGDCIIDGGGVAGARHGPSLMPGGSFAAYKYIEDILLKVAAQVRDSGHCVAYIGKGGSGNFVKMIHSGIEYGDMQLIAEAYDVLKSVGKLSNEELHQVFSEWNKGELLSFLIEITDIFSIKDYKGDGYLADKVLDKTGMKDTGKWTVQQAAELSVAAPTIASSLDSRFLSGLKDERVQAAKVFKSGGVDDILTDQAVDKQKLIDDVRQALYASKICSYAQGMNLIHAKSTEKGWDLELGELARNWKGGCCIIRAIFLDRVQKAYDQNPDLANLLVDPEFEKEIIDPQSAWRRVVCLQALALLGNAQRLEVRVVTWNNDELATEALPVHGFEHYKTKDYALAHAPFSGSSYAGGQWATGDEPLYYIVSPKDVVIAKPRDAKDHISWLLQHGWHEKALAAVEAGQGRSDLLDEVGSSYLDHLIVERKYTEAASLCPKLLRGPTSAWERWVFYFAHLRQLTVLVPYIPTENPRLCDTAYEVALVALTTNPSFHKDLLSTAKSWPPVIYSALPIISAIEPQLNTSSMTDALGEALAKLYVIDGRYEKAFALYADVVQLMMTDCQRVVPLLTQHRELITASKVVS